MCIHFIPEWNIHKNRYELIRVTINAEIKKILPEKWLHSPTSTAVEIRAYQKYLESKYFTIFVFGESLRGVPSGDIINWYSHIRLQVKRILILATIFHVHTGAINWLIHIDPKKRKNVNKAKNQSVTVQQTT